MKTVRKLHWTVLVAIVACRSGEPTVAARPSRTERTTIVPTTNATTAALGTSAPASGKVTTVPAASWSPERLRAFVLATHRELTSLAEKLVRPKNAPILGECFDGNNAAQLVKTADLLPALEKRLQGGALDCYLATYFGCRLGDWIAAAGIALHGPGGVPFSQSPVKIIEQSDRRVVADVGEADPNDVDHLGQLSDDVSAKKPNFRIKSRYVLVRKDATGDPSDDSSWRIEDRIPSFRDWECRPR